MTTSEKQLYSIVGILLCSFLAVIFYYGNKSKYAITETSTNSLISENDYTSIQSVIKNQDGSVTGSNNPSLYEQLLFELVFAGEPYSQTVKDKFKLSSNDKQQNLNFSISLVHEMISRQEVPSDFTEYIEFVLTHINDVPEKEREKLLKVSRWMEPNQKLINIAKSNLSNAINNSDFDLARVTNLFEYSGLNIPQDLQLDIAGQLSRLDSLNKSLEIINDKLKSYPVKIESLSNEIESAEQRYKEAKKRGENKFNDYFYIVREYFTDGVNAVAYEARRYGEPCLVTTKTFTFQSSGTILLEVYHNGSIKTTYNGFNREIPVYVEYTEDDAEKYSEYLGVVTPRQKELKEIEVEVASLKNKRVEIKTEISSISNSAKNDLQTVYSQSKL
ncbi:MAG: hypothetical protein WD053_06450 [Gracilimonas sp.]